MSDLELISDDDLLEELLDRFDNSCFVGMKESFDADGDNMYLMRYYGNPHACVGLLQDLAVVILDRFHANETIIDEGEEEV